MVEWAWLYYSIQLKKTSRREIELDFAPRW